MNYISCQIKRITNKRLNLEKSKVSLTLRIMQINKELELLDKQEASFNQTQLELDLK